VDSKEGRHVAADDPKWLSIAKEVADDIRSGRRPPHSKIPPADAPAEIIRYGANPNTIRDAYSYLRDLGVLRTDPRGTWVTDKTPPDRLPPRPAMSALERKLTDRLDALERRLDDHERDHPH
jgi:DNA-binding GntR family transcriptional regulator